MGLKRMGFRRPDPATAAPWLRKMPIARSGPIKKRVRRKHAGQDKAMLAVCRAQPCYLRVPGVCHAEIDTVVPCHANWSEYGKSMGRKADDKFTVPGCWHCHSWLDQGSAAADAKRATWESAFERWKLVRGQKLGIEVNRLEEA